MSVPRAVCPGNARTAMIQHLPGKVAWDDMLPVDDVAEAIGSLTRLSRAPSWRNSF